MEVNDYVRTIKGFGKVEKIEILKKDTIIYLDSGITIDYITKDFTKDEIKKMYPSSPNIIDLIEVGDYVNGYKVDFTNIENKLTYEEKNIGFYDGDGDITLFENDIKSIVTKEQFKNMEYEVK